MLNRFIFLIVFSIFSSITLAQNSSDSLHPSFEAAEHVFVGNKVSLRFKPNTDGEQGTKLKLPNGLMLSYGEMITLGGDFFGVPDEPIVMGQTEKEKRARFLNAFNTLAVDKKALEEVPKIIKVIEDEQRQLREGMERGEKPVDIYSKMSTDHNADWNCITGGLCAEDYPGMSRDLFKKVFFLKQGRYLQLAKHDFDHFGESAFTAYSVGHALAMEVAVEAGKTANTEQLALAYAMNGFACHYLSDSFAAGHIRIPRINLYLKVTPNTIGSILASYMHREDNREGLFVSNRNGDMWNAYGDAYFFDARNERNQEILQNVLQMSADELFVAYQTGVVLDSAIPNLVPDFQKLSSKAIDPPNHSPLFFWDDKKQKLLRRNNLKNPNDYSHTSIWLGWATLTELVTIYGIPGSYQAALLADKTTRDMAIKLGMITDKELLKFFQEQYKK